MIRIIFTSVLIIVLTFANSLESKAQMTLHDCMEYAVSKSTKMRIQQAASSDARVERRTRILELFTPEISASTNGYYLLPFSIFSSTSPPTVPAV